MMCCNPKFFQGPNLSFFGLGPWAIIIHGIAKLANTFISQIWFLMTPFELFFSKLSENPKKFDIGSTEFKLWQPKESPNYWIERSVVEHLSTALTWVSLIQCQKFLGFSESLERDLSNDVLQSKINLSGP